MPRVLLFNKPFNVMCQFTDRNEAHAATRATLGDFIDVPGVYPAGRLDRDSEGLVVLTGDGRLQARITQPRARLPKTYWVQVEGEPYDEALRALRGGVELKDGRTAPAQVAPMAEPPGLWPRDPPIRVRKSVPDTWMTLIITEGRNRQVRRMTAAVGHPTLRLVRFAVGAWTIDGLAPGQWRWADVGTDGSDRPPASARRARRQAGRKRRP